MVTVPPDTSCLACGSAAAPTARFAGHDRLHGLAGAVEVQVCPECGSGTTNPRVTGGCSSAADLRPQRIDSSTNTVGLSATLQYAIVGRCLFPTRLGLRVAAGLCVLALPLARWQIGSAATGTNCTC